MDEIIDEAMRPVADAVASFIFFAVPVGDTQLPLIVAWLIGGGLFFTFYLRLINIRGFRHAIAL
ncbi:MAG: alanine glycine permease, partial [Gammaproteobacteria bacterium]